MKYYITSKSKITQFIPLGNLFYSFFTKGYNLNIETVWSLAKRLKKSGKKFEIMLRVM